MENSLLILNLVKKFYSRHLRLYSVVWGANVRNCYVQNLNIWFEKCFQLFYSLLIGIILPVSPEGSDFKKQFQFLKWVKFFLTPQTKYCNSHHLT